MINYLPQLFLKLEEHIQNKNYILKIINKKRFRKQFIKEQKKPDIPDIFEEQPEQEKSLDQYFIFDEKQIDEYICHLLIYKWLLDHKDTRYRDFTFILKPNRIKIDMRDISFEDLIHFMSPQTKTDIK